MPARVQWTGLAELKEWLRTLPEALADDARDIVEDAVSDARDEIYQAYPARTGNLRNGLGVRSLDGSDDFYFGQGKRLGAGALLFNNAPHAFIFEHGTETRKTDLGADRGSMPPGNIFIPRAMKHRRRMYERLMEMMRAHALTVTGNAYAA